MRIGPTMGWLDLTGNVDGGYPTSPCRSGAFPLPLPEGTYPSHHFSRGTASTSEDTGADGLTLSRFPLCPFVRVIRLLFHRGVIRLSEATKYTVGGPTTDTYRGRPGVINSLFFLEAFSSRPTVDRQFESATSTVSVNAMERSVSPEWIRSPSRGASKVLIVHMINYHL